MADSLYAVMIQIDGDALVLPNAAVAEVCAFERFEEAEAGAPDWLAGWHVTAERRVPVLSFESLCGRGRPGSQRRGRVVIVHPLGQRAMGGGYALLAQGHPHLITIAPDAIEAAPLRPGDNDDMVLSRVRLNGKDAVIPDLEHIEARLRGLV